MKFSELKLTTPYLQLDPIFFNEVYPQPLKDPYVISVNNDAAKLLGITQDLNEDTNLLKILNGESLLKGSKPFAMCYAGHQFGYFVPRLGDGRAINLGKANGWNLQLKGAGVTLYSRQGDGKAVLRSSIREYLMSEAMHGLGIETTRALAIIGSNEDVARERWEKAAMVLRLSPTWIRFGTFEYFARAQNQKHLEALADYAINESFPQLKDEKDPYLKMFALTVEKTAQLLAKWQSVGFNHGVMNTDNMSIGGFTIDYGPFAFLDDYDFHYICNHTDHEGRYSFGNQPPVAYWNLSMLMRALSPLVRVEKLEIELAKFESYFSKTYEDLMLKKLGLESQKENDIELIRWLLGTLGASMIDYAVFFRRLSAYKGNRDSILALTQMQTPLNEWLDAYDERLTKETRSTAQRLKEMSRINPKYVLKNHILQEAIDRAQMKDFSMVDDLLHLALSPFDEHPDFDHLAQPTPNDHKNLKLSCSS